jgi:hypothetical protein
MLHSHAIGKFYLDLQLLDGDRLLFVGLVGQV